MRNARLTDVLLCHDTTDSGRKRGRGNPTDRMPKMHLSFELLIEWNFALETFLGEVRIRFVWILIGLGLTWFTCYWFSEELIFLLAKPFLTLPLDSYFVCTQLTEALSTYVATSLIACSYFVFPLISYQIWCFLIPSCYGEQRQKYNRFFYLSGFRFS